MKRIKKYQCDILSNKSGIVEVITFPHISEARKTGEKNRSTWIKIIILQQNQTHASRYNGHRQTKYMTNRNQDLIEESVQGRGVRRLEMRVSGGSWPGCRAERGSSLRYKTTRTWSDPPRPGSNQSTFSSSPSLFQPAVLLRRLPIPQPN